MSATLEAEARQTWTEQAFTTSDGTKLHYVEMGAGTPVVLIHGAGGSAVGNWSPTASPRGSPRPIARSASTCAAMAFPRRARPAVAPRWPPT